MTERDNINTGSTGGLGFSYRSYDRAYLNQDGAIHDASYFARLATIGHRIIDHGRRGVTRCVVRALVPERVLDDMLALPETYPLVEAVVPTGFTFINGRGQEPVWMMIGAVNHRSRRPLFGVSDMVTRVDQSRRFPTLSPWERIMNLRSEGFRFISRFSQQRIPEVLSLWRDSFEWDESGVTKLQKDLEANHARHSSRRSLWFSGVVDPRTDRLVALATAERLDMPLHGQQAIPIVESTEWRRADDVSRHGLVAGAVSHLNTQILTDLDGQRPTVIAETNYRSGAHHVGFAAGMDVAPREIHGRPVSQMLIQNVRVGDGYVPDGARDFTMMHLPNNARQTLYDIASRQAILKGSV